jgi:hypothetical protein
MARVSAHKASAVQQEDIEHLVTHILEEGRMVLPGIQALLGFQLVAVFNQTFSDMSVINQLLHVVAIFLSVNAICLLLTPAAIHRQGEPGVVTGEFAATASRLICAGMLPLLLSIVIDSYVVFDLITKRPIISMVLATILLAEFIHFWILLPQKTRRKQLRTTQ